MQIFDAADRADSQGFRTILSGLAHAPSGQFIPAPGHGLGFNDLDLIEAREILRAVADEKPWLIDFEKGFRIEQPVDALARSYRTGGWADTQN